MTEGYYVRLESTRKSAPVRPSVALGRRSGVVVLLWTLTGDFDTHTCNDPGLGRRQVYVRRSELRVKNKCYGFNVYTYSVGIGGIVVFVYVGRGYG